MLGLTGGQYHITFDMLGNLTVLVKGLSASHPWKGLYRQERRRIHTEVKAKVVAAVWGSAFIQILATLAVLHWDDLKKGWIAPGWFERKGWIILFFKLVLLKIASAAKNWIHSVPQTAATTFNVSSVCISFLYGTHGYTMAGAVWRGCCNRRVTAPFEKHVGVAVV